MRNSLGLTSLSDRISDSLDIFLLEDAYVTTLKRLHLGYIYNTWTHNVLMFYQTAILKQIKPLKYW